MPASSVQTCIVSQRFFSQVAASPVWFNYGIYHELCRDLRYDFKCIPSSNPCRRHLNFTLTASEGIQDRCAALRGYEFLQGYLVQG